MKKHIFLFQKILKLYLLFDFKKNHSLLKFGIFLYFLFIIYGKNLFLFGVHHEKKKKKSKD